MSAISWSDGDWPSACMTLRSSWVQIVPLRSLSNRLNASLYSTTLLTQGIIKTPTWHSADCSRRHSTENNIDGNKAMNYQCYHRLFSVHFDSWKSYQLHVWGNLNQLESSLQKRFSVKAWSKNEIKYEKLLRETGRCTVSFAYFA